MRRRHLQLIEERFCLAPLHKDFDKCLLDAVKNQDYGLVSSYATKEARKLYKLHREVMCTMHLKKGFMRFEASPHGILYCRTALEHNVIEHLLEFFHSRYPKFYVAIEWNKVTYVINRKGVVTKQDDNVSDVVSALEKKLPLMPELDGLELEKELWQGYYKSQYIDERRNIPLMKKMMPLKYRQDDCVETNVSKRCMDLRGFF